MQTPTSNGDSSATATRRIQVYARVRPLLQREHEDGEALSVASEKLLQLPTTHGGVLEYSFDSVLPPAASQADAFDLVDADCQAVLQGYNATIMAYGVSGSGKTSTYR